MRLPVEDGEVEDRLVQSIHGALVSWEGCGILKGGRGHTASAVPGKKTIVSTANAFIAELSWPLALAMTRLDLAISWLIVFALCTIWLSLWAIKLHIF